MIPNVLAIIVFAMCAFSMVRLLLGERRRRAVDAFFIRLWLRSKMLFGRKPPKPLKQQNPAHLADEAIRRAKDGGSWEGNVYKPKSFKGPRKPH